MKQCCAKEVREIWKTFGTEVIYYTTNCKTCKSFIGLTYTNKETIKDFLTKHNLKQI